MRQHNFFFKFMFLTLVWTVACLGFAAYAANRAWTQDPEIMKKIESKMGVHFSQSHIGFNFNMDDEGQFGQTSDTWKMPVPKEIIDIKAISTDFEISSTEGNEILIQADGMMDKEKTPRLLEVEMKGDELFIHEPEHNAVKGVKVKVRIPRSYGRSLEFKAVSGNIQITGLSFKSVDVKTVSGDLDVDGAVIDKVDVKTVSGEVSLSLTKNADIEVVSISGDVKLTLKEAYDTRFELKSVSGDVENSHGSHKSGKYTVSVKTTSGDIDIQ